MSIAQPEVALGSGTFSDLNPEQASPIVIDAGGGGAVVVPGGHFILVADYSRSGPDLVLTGPDSPGVVVRDFFATNEPPSLFTEGGSVVPGDLATRLAGPLAPGQYAQAGAVAPGEAIGTVDDVTGEVVAVRADGSRVSLGDGDQVYQGDVLETGGDGLVQIILADKSEFALEENGRMVLDELVFDGSGGGSLSVSIVQGVFAFVSGDIAKTGEDAMTIRTPVATLGIRGTEGAGRVDAQGENNYFTVLKGIIAVINSAGITVLDQVNATTTVVNFFSPPQVAEVLTPAALENLFSPKVFTAIRGAQVRANEREQQQLQDQEGEGESGEDGADPGDGEDSGDAEDGAEEGASDEVGQGAGEEGDADSADDGDAGGDQVADDLGPDDLDPDDLGPDDLGPDGLGPDGLGPDGLGPAGLGPAGLGPDGLAPDDLGPDGLGPDGLGPDGLGPDVPDADVDAADDQNDDGSDTYDDANQDYSGRGLSVLTGKHAHDSTRMSDSKGMNLTALDSSSISWSLGSNSNSNLSDGGPLFGDFSKGNGPRDNMDNHHGQEHPQPPPINPQPTKVIFNGTDDADNLTGNSRNNEMNGFGGDDTLVGAAGDDTLSGGAGDDLLDGGSGADVNQGGSGVDTASYELSPASVTVDLAAGTGVGGDAQDDTLSGVENLIGSDYGDTLVGDGVANVLTGGAGNDVLEGAASGDPDAWFDPASGNTHGGSGSGPAFDTGTGISSSDVTFTPGSSGGVSSKLTLVFAASSLTVGDSFRFGVDTDFVAGTNLQSQAGGLFGDSGVIATVFFSNDQSVTSSFVNVSSTVSKATIEEPSTTALVTLDATGSDTFNDVDYFGVSFDECADLSVTKIIIDLRGNGDTLVGGSGSDTFIYNAPTDGDEVSVNVTPTSLNLVSDSITAFESGSDTIELVASGFTGFSAGDDIVEDTNFFVIGGEYDGTNAGAKNSSARIVFDGKDNLIVDSNGDTAGYSLVANVQGNNVQADDLVFS